MLNIWIIEIYTSGFLLDFRQYLLPKDCGICLAPSPRTDVGIYQIKPNSSPVKLLSKLTPGLLYSKLCCCISSTSFEVSHSMQQFGITEFFEFSHPVLHSQGSTCSPHGYQIFIKHFKFAIRMGLRSLLASTRAL